MTTFKNGQAVTSTVIAADPETIFNITFDTDLCPQWGPSVSAVDCADRYINAKSRGRVRTGLGLWLPFIRFRLLKISIFEQPGKNHLADGGRLRRYFFNLVQFFVRQIAVPVHPDPPT